MTLLHIWNKLRKYNKGDYRQIRFCTGFAVMLISSYIMMLFSPLVQNVLPAGGDTQKIVNMIFVLALLGCFIFCIYATGLFLRYKSREIGVFLALGTEKSKIKKTIIIETAQMAVICSAIGIAAGSALSFLLGNIMKLAAKESTSYPFAFTAAGFAGSFLFAAAVTLIMMMQTAHFLKRTNIMDILNEQRKQEPLRKLVSKNYLILSIVFLVAGVLIAFVIPTIYTNMTHRWLGPWTNLFYILTVIGLYRILVYSISNHKKGSHPQKYYNHVISYSISKFTGASTVRNMLVITLLLIGGIFALFFPPMDGFGSLALLTQNEDEYSYFYTQDADEITKPKLTEMATKYNISIDDYREAEFIQALGSGIMDSDLDENGEQIIEYLPKYAMYECISQSNFNSVTGQKLTVKNGTYYMIQRPSAIEDIFNRFDDMDRLYLPDHEKYISMVYSGNVNYSSLVINEGFEERARYVISDSDYQALTLSADTSSFVTHILFNTADNENTVTFSKDLYKQFALCQSESMKIAASYNLWQAQLEGKNYAYNARVIYDPDNSVAATDWRYRPTFVSLDKSNFILTFSVKFMLFLYMAVICLAACTIISYTRSQNVATSNRQIFQDIEKLGANHKYRKKLMREQIQKVFLLPTAIGCTMMFLFETLLMYMNDGRYTPDEIQVIGFVSITIIVIVLYQYAIYRISEKKAAQILDLI